MSGMAERAERALIKAMGEKPAKLVPGSVAITGRTVEWQEMCAGKCAHFRTSLAPYGAITDYLDILERAA